MKFVTIALTSILSLTGCASHDNRGEPALGGVIAGSTLVVAVPLIPVAEAYHAISGDREKARQQVEGIRSKLDPVYEQRIAIILQRDPIADAEDAIARNVVALLPSLPDGDVFPGLMTSSYDLGPFADNTKKLHDDEILMYLQRLLSPDPIEKQIEGRGFIYTGPTRNRFSEATWKYKSSFNQTIYNFHVRREMPAGIGDAK